jgi:N-dimethylarginine dimethylaminohydrolase
MAHAERRGEVAHVVAVLAALGYRVAPLTGAAQRFEGMGDGLWHPGRRLLWGGVGPRTELAAWAEIARAHAVPVVALELVDQRCYHLDTCLALLDERTCLWLPAALAPRSRELVAALFPRRIEADEREARELLACNALCADGESVLIEARCERTRAQLAAAGYRVVPLDTSEYAKAGGSVFCMKLLHGPIAAR